MPRMIFKIGNNNLAELRESIRANLAPLGVDHVDVGQLCLGGEYAEQFRVGGPCYDDFRRLKGEGLVRHFVMEVFPWTSAVPLAALRGGHTDGVIDAFIFYLNPLQRFAANPLWDLILERNAPVIAMRTVCGAPVHVLRDVPGGVGALPAGACGRVAPIYERSGVTDWTEFCVRFAFSFAPCRRRSAPPASANISRRCCVSAGRMHRTSAARHVAELSALQRRWSERGRRPRRALDDVAVAAETNH